MRRLLLLLLFFLSHNLASMQSLARIARKNVPKNMQLCLHTQPNFGKTHFIRGYKTPRAPKIKQKNSQKISLEQKEYIKDGSSAHLIDTTRHTQSFFSTIHNLHSIILAMLTQAKKSICIAAFAFTDAGISKQLINAHKKGITVSVIMDAGNMRQPYSKAQELINNGIMVWRYDPTLHPNYKKKQYMPYMHHKCYIIDEEIVMTGSANLTQAIKNNAESLNLIKCEHSVAEHSAEFERLRQYSIKCIPHVAA